MKQKPSARRSVCGHPCHGKRVAMDDQSQLLARDYRCAIDRDDSRRLASFSRGAGVE